MYKGGEVIEVLSITGADTRVTGKHSMERFHRRPLKIAGLSGKPKWIKLQGLPVDEQKIATSEKVKRLNHLEGIAKEISSNTDISVGLLIGANCAEALEPKS